MTYTHLTQQERYQIHALKRQNISVACIAAELQRDRSTISRELKRNAGAAGYKPNLAHKHARARQCERRNALSFSPAVVDKRSRIGDWEGDTVIGQGHQGVLVTLVERKSRYTLAAQLNSRHSNKVTAAVIELLRPHKAQC